jgi:uncharacterized membrane protein
VLPSIELELSLQKPKAPARQQGAYPVRNRQLLVGAGVGAGLAYFLDPNRGARRRARVRDFAAHSRNVGSRALTIASRDLVHRGYGTAAELGSWIRQERAVDDEILVPRVRSKLGRVCSHAHAIEVGASNGIVTLKGPILADEAPTLVAAIRRVRGVREVVDALDTHEQAGDIPALQAGRLREGNRIDVMQQHWAPATRVLVGAAGAALMCTVAARRNRPGMVAGVVGAGLLARAATNLPVRRLAGIGSRRAVDVQKTITINAPVGEVYAFWSEYQNFPKFMSRVLEVRASDHRPGLSHWKVTGPAGAPVSFDAEITSMVPNEMLAWRSAPGALVAHAGMVRFTHLSDGHTRVQVRMSYNPPAGWLGHGVALAAGVDPKSSLDEDLARMKTLIETGRAPHDAVARRWGSAGEGRLAGL